MKYSIPPSEIGGFMAPHTGRIAGIKRERLFRSLEPQDRQLPISLVRDKVDEYGLKNAGDTVAQFSSVPNAQMFMALQQGIDPAIARQMITKEMAKQKLLAASLQQPFQVSVVDAKERMPDLRGMPGIY